MKGKRVTGERIIRVLKETESEMDRISCTELGLNQVRVPRVPD